MRNRITRWLRWTLLVVLATAAVFVVRATWLRPATIPVSVFRAAPGLVEETVSNSKAGTVKSRRRAVLSPEIGGRVSALLVRAGDRVQAGQVLLQLSDTDYRSQIELQQRSSDAAAAGARQACQAKELADRELARHRELARDQLVAISLLDQVQSRRDMAIAECEAARSRASEAEATVALARTNLAKTVLRAPFAGVIAEVKTEVGEWITPSPPGLPIPPVVELIDLGAIYVSAPLDEVDVAKLRVGLPVRITMDSLPGRQLPGRVVRVAPYVLDRQDQNRTFEIEVGFDPDGLMPGDRGALRPGTSADVEVILDARQGAVRVPTYALIEAKRVFVIRSGRLVSVPVTTGLRNWDFTEIRGGLAAGELVVVSLDRPEIQEGANVRVQSETLR